MVGARRRDPGLWTVELIQLCRDGIVSSGMRGPCLDHASWSFGGSASSRVGIYVRVASFGGKGSHAHATITQVKQAPVGRFEIRVEATREGWKRTGSTVFDAVC